MMKEDTVGEAGIELPALGQLGVNLAVVNPEFRHFQGLQAGLVGCVSEQAGSWGAQCRKQDQFADVVQQRRKVGFVRVRAAGGDSDATRDFGNEQRMPPDGGEIGCGNIALPVEELLGRQAGRQ